ncbi:uncharacterized protein BYT42DRAFT_642941 [Radiomyces spectabilis]|uniref:uncharacterized protein n=1 Tax=Radiomyces spectabilis TaxID=64574 RepID=UPI00221EA079|nr:uncharacterized protein BYT42DRAFT_642941 [Radiomyces spectabilis]KAI8388783.1 hypothetical protein BYT42DRAFT_642941 [Radiomyces spectabilis]
MLKSMVSALLQSLTMIIFLLSAIPLIVHFRLRNWPAFYISLWLTVYNLIQFANITLSQHIFDDSKQDNIYQFCTIYAGTTTALQLAISFGSFRLLQQLCSLVTPAERWTLRKRLLGVLSSSRKASDSDADHTTHRSVSSTIIYSASHTSSHSSFGSWYRSRIAVYHSRITDFFWGIALPIALIVIWKTSSATLPKNQDAFQYVYLSGVGCAMVMVDSLLSVLILCITPAVMSACSLYYTVYIIVRLASSRRALNALLAERTSISQSTFQRLVGFCAFYDIIAMVYTIYSMVYFFTNTAPTIPMPEDELIMLNKLALWSKPLISPTILLLAVLSLAWILFFGTNTEAINMYRQIYGPDM